MLAMEIDLMSERGGRRYNEDACGHLQIDDWLCCALADGAGGHGGGDVAARLVVRELLSAFAQGPAEAALALKPVLCNINELLIGQRAPGPTQNMHTTLVCLVINAHEHTARWAHAGDSRLYWFREGQLMDRTRDHSLVQSLVDAGVWHQDDIKSHARGNELISALGIAAADLTVSVSSEPAHLEAGDAFLLCTDGCWEYLDDSTLLQSLSAADSPSRWLADLKARIELATQPRSSHDNFTAVAVWVSVAPPSTAGFMEVRG